jgi:hypothetical protein
VPDAEEGAQRIAHRGIGGAEGDRERVSARSAGADERALSHGETGDELRSHQLPVTS